MIHNDMFEKITEIFMKMLLYQLEEINSKITELFDNVNQKAAGNDEMKERLLKIRNDLHKIQSRAEQNVLAAKKDIAQASPELIENAQLSILELKRAYDEARGKLAIIFEMEDFRE
ncbi:hypothetical protein C4569_03490 [Candidatus Parcubacteria bacterium]|nr:MAG: hypothetical protein C4569_03490 [Candidatus Parcubacteria bacterium]